MRRLYGERCPSQDNGLQRLRLSVCYLEEPDLTRVREEYGEAAEVDWRALRAEARTRTAPLEAAEYARGEGRFDEMHEALFRAFFEDGKDIGDTEVLLEVWGSAGLDREGIRAALEEGRYAEKVLADEELARRLGVGSVPTMFVGSVGEPLEKAEAIVGAQPYSGRIEAAVEWALSRL